MAAELAWLDFDTRWKQASPVTHDQLTPKVLTSTTHVLRIKHGATDPGSTRADVLLQDRTGLGVLRDLGTVKSVRYYDRYIFRSARALRMLDEVLSLFQPAPGATAQLIGRNLQEQYGPSVKAKDLFNAPEPPDNLNVPQSQALLLWLQNRSKSSGWKLTWKQLSWSETRHPRKLLVEFAPGSTYERMEILFEHGVDWVRPVPGAGPWINRGRIADETHIVVLLH